MLVEAWLKSMFTPSAIQMKRNTRESISNYSSVMKILLETTSRSVVIRFFDPGTFICVHEKNTDSRLDDRKTSEANWLPKKLSHCHPVWSFTKHLKSYGSSSQTGNDWTLTLLNWKPQIIHVVFSFCKWSARRFQRICWLFLFELFFDAYTKEGLIWTTLLMKITCTRRRNTHGCSPSVSDRLLILITSSLIKHLKVWSMRDRFWWENRKQTGEISCVQMLL